LVSKVENVFGLKSCLVSKVENVFGLKSCLVSKEENEFISNHVWFRRKKMYLV